MPRKLIVVGPVGSGKTHLVLALAAEWTARGMGSVAGVAQPRSLDPAGRTLGYDLLDLETGERMPLARRREPKGFAFDPRGFVWAADRIQRQAELVCVDEIGWLEARGEGHAPALRRAVERRIEAWVFAVREDRQAELERSLLPPGETRTVRLPGETALPDPLLAWLRRG